MAKKIIILYQPVVDCLSTTGKVTQRALKPRDTYEVAEDALRKALLAEEDGSNGQIEKFFVTVEDSAIVTPPGAGKLVLPN